MARPTNAMSRTATTSPRTPVTRTTTTRTNPKTAAEPEMTPLLAADTRDNVSKTVSAAAAGIHGDTRKKHLTVFAETALEVKGLVKDVREELENGRGAATKTVKEMIEAQKLDFENRKVEQERLQKLYEETIGKVIKKSEEYHEEKTLQDRVSRVVGITSAGLILIIGGIAFVIPGTTSFLAVATTAGIVLPLTMAVGGFFYRPIYEGYRCIVASSCFSGCRERLSGCGRFVKSLFSNPCKKSTVETYIDSPDTPPAGSCAVAISAASTHSTAGLGNLVGSQSFPAAQPAAAAAASAGTPILLFSSSAASPSAATAGSSPSVQVAITVTPVGNSPAHH